MCEELPHSGLPFVRSSPQRAAPAADMARVRPALALARAAASLLVLVSLVSLVRAADLERLQYGHYNHRLRHHRGKTDDGATYSSCINPVSRLNPSYLTRPSASSVGLPLTVLIDTVYRRCI